LEDSITFTYSKKSKKKLTKLLETEMYPLKSRKKNVVFKGEKNLECIILRKQKSIEETKNTNINENISVSENISSWGRKVLDKEIVRKNLNFKGRG
jgi:hypothetical protein